MDHCRSTACFMGVGTGYQLYDGGVCPHSAGGGGRDGTRQSYLGSQATGLIGEVKHPECDLEKPTLSPFGQAMKTE